MSLLNSKTLGGLAGLAVVTLFLGVVLSPLVTGSDRVLADATAPTQDRVLALDPLTPEEVELATQIANSDERVRAALGKTGAELINVQFLALKPAREEKRVDPERMRIGRHAAVIFYRSDIDQGVHVVVDLEKKAVAMISKIEGRSVPVGVQEVTRALNLALQHEAVKTLLGARVREFKVAALSDPDRPETRVEGLRVVAISPRDPCYRHRCINLLFRLPEGYLAGTAVTVDLTTQKVRVERTVK